MHVDVVLHLLSAMLEIFQERAMDAEDNSPYAEPLHWRRCVLGISICIFKTASLTEFVHTYILIESSRNISYNILLSGLKYLL